MHKPDIAHTQSGKSAYHYYGRYLEFTSAQSSLPKREAEITLNIPDTQTLANIILKAQFMLSKLHAEHFAQKGEPSLQLKGHSLGRHLSSTCLTHSPAEAILKNSCFWALLAVHDDPLCSKDPLHCDLNLQQVDLTTNLTDSDS